MTATVHDLITESRHCIDRIRDAYHDADQVEIAHQLHQLDTILDRIAITA